ncbi:hypothetical protein B0X71_20195 (plasmid) [Planococcus lenghuensis]|uniref:Uncharacterized protein n=1 Tax=Planococcus lenghuensis TaxID=2213202 RepID=A0A1Q2L4X6_9BACL|nr:hypothetical protein B0X71_20195 [Planococcus lenghuensis]
MRENTIILNQLFLIISKETTEVSSEIVLLIASTDEENETERPHLKNCCSVFNTPVEESKT